LQEGGSVIFILSALISIASILETGDEGGGDVDILSTGEEGGEQRREKEGRKLRENNDKGKR
jgi:hypothetical protein